MGFPKFIHLVTVEFDDNCGDIRHGIRGAFESEKKALESLAWVENELWHCTTAAEFESVTNVELDNFEKRLDNKMFRASVKSIPILDELIREFDAEIDELMGGAPEKTRGRLLRLAGQRT